MAAPAAAAPAAVPLAKKALLKHGPRLLTRRLLARRRRKNGQDDGENSNGCGCLLAVLAVVLVIACSPLLIVACAAAIARGGTSTGPLDPDAAEIAGIPARAAVAYQRAAGQCDGLDWPLLAAVGAIESRHGQTGGATIDPDTGEARPWIFGPPLNGLAGTAAIPIGNRSGWWGLTGPWTQAVGPMQILPDTFDAHDIDGDGDGTTNPHDIDDASATAASYLCTASGGRIDGPETVARIYNPGSASYADQLATEHQRILDALNQPGAPVSGVAGSATVCPVTGTVTFTDTWGAPRSGARTHQGVDIFAPTGTPVVAPADGQVEHYHNQLGGLSYRLYGDDATYYYGTHLSAYENVGAGWVPAGTTIGYVGTTGNAATTPPHLHWEIHPGGRGSPAINPTPTAETLCPT